MLHLYETFLQPLVEADSEGRAGWCCAPHPKEEPTPAIPNDTYIKPICPSGAPGAMAAGSASRYKTGLWLETYH